MELNRVSWRKAKRSGGNGGECVELAVLANVIAVRDSKNPEMPPLVFSSNAWRNFTNKIKSV